MKVLDLLFKKDHTGKRTPTILMWSIICVGVFVTFFLSKEEKVVKDKTPEQEIIKRQDVTNASIEASQNGKRKEDILASLLLSGAKKEKATKDSERLTRNKADAQVIVYDNTKSSDKYKAKHKLPLGTMIECMLIHNIVTNNFSSPVIAQVADDFYFNGILLLSRDTRIYGEARAGRERDRVLVAFKTIVLHDGTEFPIQARGLNADGSGGIKATIVNEFTKEKLLTKVMNFFSGAFLGFQEKTTNAITGIDQVSVNSRNAILEGGSKVFSEEAKRMQDEVRNAQGYGVIVAGERLIIYFDESVEIRTK
ncbi:MAG TPA: TrbI/VirB10 family protein [Candidatus Omnitrophota bacterium]|nr:TrbI/VirB10 family protein [Candidatus Omnitrophota bacterium]